MQPLTDTYQIASCMPLSNIPEPSQIMDDKENLLTTATKPELLYLFMTYPLIVGSSVNLIVLIEISFTTFGSTLTKCLLCTQSVFDSLVCIYAAYDLFPKTYEATAVPQLVCRFIVNRYLFSFLRLLSVSNVVCLTIDKFLAVVYMQTYKSRVVFYTVGCYVFIFSYTFMATLVRQTNVHFPIPGVCTESQKSAIWLFVQIMGHFAVPVSLILTFHISATVRLYRLRSSFGSPTVQRVNVDDGSSMNDPPTCVSKQQCPIQSCEMAEQNKLKHATTAMSIGTFGYTTSVTTVELISFILTLLAAFGIVDFTLNSQAVRYYTCCVGLLACCHPIILIFSVTSVRLTIIAQYSFIQDRLNGALAKLNHSTE
ncbi:amine GPCR [Clonorchis sinensis]|uniref:Amine GPCR n=1 Tax=Clonorchis sinensis TaxID=79923 RepID=H2KRE0_CLOSI|nr:amine GPCR [Clonorchis sinensis]